jgi:rubrerythrin
VNDHLDFSHDELRRATRDLASEHTQTLRPFRDGLSRLFDRTDVPTAMKADVVLGGVARRRFLRIGATSVAAAAVLAACGGGDDDESASEPTTTTAKPSAADITVLRTASSLELVAVAVYDQAIKSGIVTTPAVLEAARTFMGQHKDHAATFEALTKKLGGEPFTTANPAVTQQLQPRVAALAAERDAVALALDLERAAAATYLGSVGTFGDTSLNEVVMSVGGVEARHATVLAGVLGQPGVPAAFATTTGAVAPGTGL